MIVKKTNTLNNNEIQQYCTLFSDVFNKQMSIEEFFKKYQNKINEIKSRYPKG